MSPAAVAQNPRTSAVLLVAERRRAAPGNIQRPPVFIPTPGFARGLGATPPSVRAKTGRRRGAAIGTPRPAMRTSSYMQAAPRLLSLATATPAHVIRQEEVVRLSERAFDRSRSEIERLLPVFANAGIETRYFCMPIEWYLEPHGWIERSRLYVDHAVDLAVGVARTCLEQARCSVDDIDGIVTVSTTGIATPSLDALVMER